MSSASLLPLVGIILSVDLLGECSGPQVFPTTISNLQSVLKNALTLAQGLSCTVHNFLWHSDRKWIQMNLFCNCKKCHKGTAYIIIVEVKQFKMNYMTYTVLVSKHKIQFHFLSLPCTIIKSIQVYMILWCINLHPLSCQSRNTLKLWQLEWRRV